MLSLGEKVAAVCQVMRDAMTSMNSQSFLRPLVTSHSVLGDIHGALRLIKDAKEAQLAGQSAPIMTGSSDGASSNGGVLCPSITCIPPKACLHRLEVLPVASHRM